jgi:hypothetical protein
LAGCAFLLDDPSEPTTEGAAGSLLLRRSLRMALLLPAVAAWWVAVVWRVRAVQPGLPLPVAALTLEAAALLASRDPAHRRLPSWLRGLTHWRTRGRAARAVAGRSGSPDAAGRVERSVG